MNERGQKDPEVSIEGDQKDVARKVMRRGRRRMDALAALNRVLLKEKRYDDLARASSDAAYRQKLLEDLGIE